MARGKIPTVASLDRRAKNIQTRAKNLAIRQKQAPAVGSKGDRPRMAVKYKASANNEEYTVTASKAGVEFFTLAALGVAASDGSPRPPAGFRPNLVFARKGKSSGAVVTSKLSDAKYLSYSETFTKGKPTNYSAPLQGDSATEIQNALKAIYVANKAILGEHGTLRFVSEKFPLSFA